MTSSPLCFYPSLRDCPNVQSEENNLLLLILLWEDYLMWRQRPPVTKSPSVARGCATRCTLQRCSLPQQNHSRYKKSVQRTQNGRMFCQSPVLKCSHYTGYTDSSHWVVVSWLSDVTLANEMKNMSTTHWVVWVVVINVIWWWKLFGNESPRAPFSVSNFWEIPYWHYCRTVADKCFLQSWAVHNFVIQLITKHSE